MFSTNFLSEFVYCILNCYAHMNILQMEYAHYKCKLLLLLLLLRWLRVTFVLNTLLR